MCLNKSIHIFYITLEIAKFVEILDTISERLQFP